MTIKGNPNSYYTATVESMDGNLEVDEAKYYLSDTKGTVVESGKVSDIDGKEGNVKFNDVDGDSKITPEDNFRLKENNNGGKCGSNYKFTIKYTENNEVVMSQKTP